MATGKNANGELKAMSAVKNGLRSAVPTSVRQRFSEEKAAAAGLVGGAAAGLIINGKDGMKDAAKDAMAMRRMSQERRNRREGFGLLRGQSEARAVARSAITADVNKGIANQKLEQQYFDNLRNSLEKDIVAATGIKPEGDKTPVLKSNKRNKVDKAAKNIQKIDRELEDLKIKKKDYISEYIDKHKKIVKTDDDANHNRALPQEAEQDFLDRKKKVDADGNIVTYGQYIDGLETKRDNARQKLIDAAKSDAKSWAVLKKDGDDDKGSARKTILDKRFGDDMRRKLSNAARGTDLSDEEFRIRRAEREIARDEQNLDKWETKRVELSEDRSALKAKQQEVRKKKYEKTGDVSNLRSSDYLDVANEVWERSSKEEHNRIKGDLVANDLRRAELFEERKSIRKGNNVDDIEDIENDARRTPNIDPSDNDDDLPDIDDEK